MTINTFHPYTQAIFATCSKLIDCGLTPVPIEKKQPIFKDFPSFHVDPQRKDGLFVTKDLVIEWLKKYANAGVALLTGNIVAIDIDDESIWGVLAPLLPPTTCIKRGRRGWTLFYRNAGVERSRVIRNVLDGHVLFEVLAAGRYTVLPPTVHPTTGAPYDWCVSPWYGASVALWDAVQAGTLGELSQAHVEQIEASLVAAGMVATRRAATVAGGEHEALSEDQAARLKAWVAPRLAQRLAEIRSAGEGGRQDAMNRAVYDLARFVAAGVIDEGELREAVREACAENGFLKERGGKLWQRDFDKALHDGESLPLPELDDARARFSSAPTLPVNVASAGLAAIANSIAPNEGLAPGFNPIGLSGLHRNKEGHVRRIIQNLDMIFEHLGMTFSRDVFSKVRYMNGERLCEDVKIDLMARIERDYQVSFAYDYLNKIITANCNAKSFHPLLDYLNALVWDGKPRIQRWLTDWCGAEDSELIQQFAMLWMIAAVRRIRHPGCEMSTMLILEGEQGILKSTMLKTLAVNENWYSDSIGFQIETKNFIPASRGIWIFEFGEMKNFSKTDANFIKNFMSITTDRGREVYEKEDTIAPRQCVFSGTTNGWNYLVDETGNRRFWPVAVKTCNIDAIKANIDQMWAEAAHYEAQGVSHILHPRFWPLAAEAQDARMVEDPMETALMVRARTLPADVTISMAWALDVLEIALERQAAVNTRVGTILKKIGFERVRISVDGRQVWVYRRGAGSEPRMRGK